MVLPLTPTISDVPLLLRKECNPVTLQHSWVTKECYSGKQWNGMASRLMLLSNCQKMQSLLHLRSDIGRTILPGLTPLQRLAQENVLYSLILWFHYIPKLTWVICKLKSRKQNCRQKLEEWGPRVSFQHWLQQLACIFLGMEAGPDLL